MSDYIPTKGYIYLLKMFDTINHITIYKVGKSINFYKRFLRYNYAEILIFISSDDITKDENEIINLFNQYCTLDTGREFFRAKDDYFVKKLYFDYFADKNNKIIKNNMSISSIISTDSNISNVSNDSNISNVSNDSNISNVSNDSEGNEINTLFNIIGMGNVNTLSVITIDNLNNKSFESVENIENIENDENNENDENENDNIDDIDDMSDIQNNKTCPTCKNTFEFPSRLKSHFENTIHCKKTTNYINKFFRKFDKKAEFHCNICNKKFTKKQNLQRHIVNTNCNKLIQQNRLLNEIENIKIEISKLNVNN